jgi:hypothetical protein
MKNKILKRGLAYFDKSVSLSWNRYYQKKNTMSALELETIFNGLAKNCREATGGYSLTMRACPFSVSSQWHLY